MSQARCALAIVLIFLLHTVLPAQQPAIVLDKNDPELRAILTEIEADAESARLKAKIPGMSIVIVHDQDVLLAKGFGYADLEKKIPADPQTVYRIGSFIRSRSRFPLRKKWRLMKRLTKSAHTTCLRQ